MHCKRGQNRFPVSPRNPFHSFCRLHANRFGHRFQFGSNAVCTFRSKRSMQSQENPPLQPPVFSIFGWLQRTTEVDPTQMDHTAQQSMIRRSRNRLGFIWIGLDHSSLELTKPLKKKRDTTNQFVSRFFFHVLQALEKNDPGRFKLTQPVFWTF